MSIFDHTRDVCPDCSAKPLDVIQERHVRNLAVVNCQACGTALVVDRSDDLSPPRYQRPFIEPPKGLDAGWSCGDEALGVPRVEGEAD